uniref:Dynein light chain Tctex-type family member 5 n=1 Tax=Ailuropoda melanoleuca TaxID=9646 RepID=A0A7N5KIZ7_AILME
MMMSGVAKDRMAHPVKKRSSVSSLSGHEFRQKELHGYTKNSRSTVSYMDEPSQRDDPSRLTVQMENTYQLAKNDGAALRQAPGTCPCHSMTES